MMNTPSRFAFQALALLMGASLAQAALAAEHAAKPAAEIVEKADSGKAPKAEAPASRATTPRGAIAPSSPARTRQPEPPAEAASGVSMTELRDLIDQKIAEVRAKQETAPVVRLNNNAAPARKAPAKKKAASPAAVAGVTAGAGNNSAQATALADAHRNNVPPPADANEPAWSYSGPQGPEQWGKIKPEYSLCGNGKRQSPIDIREGIKVTLDPIQFNYHPTAFRVLDTGRTVQVNVEAGNSFTVNGRRYDLQRIEFRRPSEERVNGRQFEMSAHLIHKDMDGRLAVIAVLMDQGAEHPMVQLVWNSLPLEKYTDQASSVAIDMAQMLPDQKQYQTYMGSLSTPPCTEGVLWMVMKQPATLSREQIGVFSRLYPMNARPIQPTAGRLIKDGQ